MKISLSLSPKSFQHCISAIFTRNLSEQRIAREEIDYCVNGERRKNAAARRGRPPSRRFAAATEIGACKREPPKRDLLEFRFLREWTPCSRFFVEKIAGDRGSTLHMYGLFVSRCQVLRGELNLRETKGIRGRREEREESTGT